MNITLLYLAESLKYNIEIDTWALETFVTANVKIFV